MTKRIFPLLWPGNQKEVEWPEIKWPEIKWPEIKWPNYDPEQLTAIGVGTSPHIDIEATKDAMNAIETFRAQEFDLDNVQWRLVEHVEGESAAEWLKRCDTAFYDRIKAELERCIFIRDEPHILFKKIWIHSEQHAQRRYLVNQVILEETAKLLANPIQIKVSEEHYRQHFLGHWPAVANTCKCGVAWDSMLYGATCAKCGEKRPRDAVIGIDITKLDGE